MTSNYQQLLSQIMTHPRLKYKLDPMDLAPSLWRERVITDEDIAKIKRGTGLAEKQVVFWDQILQLKNEMKVVKELHRVGKDKDYQLLVSLLEQFYPWLKEDQDGDEYKQMEATEKRASAAKHRSKSMSHTDENDGYATKNRSQSDASHFQTNLCLSRVSVRSQHGKERRIRGSLIGALFGSCVHVAMIDSPFQVEQWFENCLSNPRPLQYEANFAMLKDVLDSILEKHACNDYKAMAKNRTTVQVFCQWEQTDFRDIFQCARQLFDGKGSKGVMGCIRAIPIALALSHDREPAEEVSMVQCALTHSHPNALMNTFLLSSAITFAIEGQKWETLVKSVADGIKDRIRKMDSVPGHQWFKSKLERIDELLLESSSSSLDKFQCVCAANFDEQKWEEQIMIGYLAFLKACQSQDSSFCHENPLVTALMYAHRSGGLFEITAIVAGALMGAYWGDTWVTETLLANMEDARYVYEAASVVTQLASQNPLKPIETQV